MAYTYSAYEEEASDSARLTMLRQHISEVQAEIGANLKIEGRSRDNAPFVDYLTNVLRPRFTELRSSAAASTGGQFTKWRAVDG